ncbi:MAG TPA: hypothetical protein VI997_01820, partial [Candidatus Thermoplasmatota archaeon]|nr:hypothetical protein [Candidatus Thermoplasmatota archaeon]
PPSQDDILREDPFAITFQTAGNPTTGFLEKADFSLLTPFKHNVTITGRNVFRVNLFVSGPQTLTYNVQIVDRGGGEIASATFAAPAGGTGQVQGDLVTKTANNRHTFSGVPGNRDFLRLVVVAQQATIDPQNQAGTWTLRYGNEEAASSVRMITEDAVKVAAWTEDEDKRVTTAFRFDTTPNAKNWIRGFFAVKSAFGFSDFDDNPGSGFVDPETGQFEKPREIAPTAELLRGTEGISFTDTEGQVTRVDLVRDSEFSAEEEGLMLYRFDPDFDHIDYQNKTAKPSGPYEIRYRMQFRPDDALHQAPSSLSATAHFAIATAALVFGPYPGESLSHQTSPGRTSTFVLLAKNDGEVYDNLTLELTAVPAALPGWGATLGGPGLKSGNRVELPSKTEGLVTVTIQSPASAKVGDAATYQLRGRSQVDPALQTQPIALIVSLIPEAQARPGAGVIVPGGETSVRAGGTATVPTYLWNKGSGPGDLTMGLLAQDAQGWRNQSLVFAGVERTDKVTVEEIQPGNIVEIGVRVSAVRASAPARTYDIQVNATTADIAEPPVGTIRFRQELTAGFLLRMLSGFNGANTHVVEMNRSVTDPRDVRRDKDIDALDGTWYRLWITNVGASDDTYRVQATNYIEEGGYDQNFTQASSTFQDGRHAWGQRGGAAVQEVGCTTQGCPPMVGYRNQLGEFTDVTT